MSTETADGQPDSAPPAPPQRVALSHFLRYFLTLGAFGFGGPIATVGYMQRDLVERRRWLEREDFLNGVALGQTMPGPLAAQVAMWVGFLQRGALGALAVAAAFVLPSFLIVVALGFFYVRYQGLPWVQAVFYGIGPAIMAIIAIAAVKLARLTNKVDPRLWVISAVILIITAASGAEIAVLFIAAGVVMIVWDAPPRFLRGRNLAPLALPVLVPGVVAGVSSPNTLRDLFLFFLKAGAFIFGSGLAIVPFLREGVVNQYHWLTPNQFLDAVAVGLITPGPVVITAAFIGYLVAGLLGAVIASIGIFTPIFAGVVIPGHWFIRHRHNLQIQAFVKGATAAAAGAIGGATIVLTQQAVRDIPTVAIALVSLGVLLRFKVAEPILVLLAAVAGVAIHR
jgi:chromate transporter